MALAPVRQRVVRGAKIAIFWRISAVFASIARGPCAMVRGPRPSVRLPLLPEKKTPVRRIRGKKNDKSDALRVPISTLPVAAAGANIRYLTRRLSG